MREDDATSSAWSEHPLWMVDEEHEHVTHVLKPDSAEQTARRPDLVDDANKWELSFCRDFRALHQFNHDHDCTETCIKCVDKKR